MLHFAFLFLLSFCTSTQTHRHTSTQTHIYTEAQKWPTNQRKSNEEKSLENYSQKAKKIKANNLTEKKRMSKKSGFEIDLLNVGRRRGRGRRMNAERILDWILPFALMSNAISMLKSATVFKPVSDKTKEISWPWNNNDFMKQMNLNYCYSNCKYVIYR